MIYVYSYYNTLLDKWYFGITENHILHRYCQHYISNTELGYDLRENPTIFKLAIEHICLSRDEAQSFEHTLIQQYPHIYNSHPGCFTKSIQIDKCHKIYFYIDDNMKNFLNTMPTFLMINEYFGKEVKQVEKSIYMDIYHLFSSTTFKDNTIRQYASILSRACKRLNVTINDLKQTDYASIVSKFNKTEHRPLSILYDILKDTKNE